MRKLMAIAIGLMLTGVATSGAFVGLENLSYDGSLEVSGNSAKNETDYSDTGSDKRGNTTTRVRVGINADVTEGVSGRVELMRPGGTRLYGNANTTIAAEEANFQISNAYVDFEDLFGLNQARLGRQYVGEPGDLVWNIAPTDDDSLPTASIDGLLLQNNYAEDKLGIEIFTGKAAEDDGVANTNNGDVTGDVNLTAVHVDLNVIPNGRVRLGFLHGVDENATVVPAGPGGTQSGDDNKLRTYRLGVDGSAKDGMITYRAEFLQNAGSFNGQGANVGASGSADLDYGGNAIDLGVGVNVNETSAGNFSFGLNYLMASGDNDLTDNDDDSFHDFGVMGAASSDRIIGEILGKSNTLAPTGLGGPVLLGVNSSDVTGTLGNGTSGPGKAVIHLQAKYEPAWWEKGWFRIDFINANTAEDSIKTSTATNATNTDIDGGIGTEIDITIGYNQSENVSFEVGYATLSVGDALVGIANGFGPPIAGQDDSVSKWFARTKIAWGGEDE